MRATKKMKSSQLHAKTQTFITSSHFPCFIAGGNPPVLYKTTHTIRFYVACKHETEWRSSAAATCACIHCAFFHLRPAATFIVNSLIVHSWCRWWDGEDVVWHIDFIWIFLQISIYPHVFTMPIKLNNPCCLLPFLWQSSLVKSNKINFHILTWNVCLFSLNLRFAEV